MALKTVSPQHYSVGKTDDKNSKLFRGNMVTQCASFNHGEYSDKSVNYTCNEKENPIS